MGRTKGSKNKPKTNDPKMRLFKCPECGRLVETIAVEVWCSGRRPDWHRESQKCKEVQGDDRPAQNSDDQQ